MLLLHVTFRDGRMGCGFGGSSPLQDCAGVHQLNVNSKSSVSGQRRVYLHMDTVTEYYNYTALVCYSVQRWLSLSHIMHATTYRNQATLECSG